MSFRQADLSWARRFAVASPRFICHRWPSTVLSQDSLGWPILHLQLTGALKVVHYYRQYYHYYLLSKGCKQYLYTVPINLLYIGESDSTNVITVKIPDDQSLTCVVTVYSVVIAELAADSCDTNTAVHIYLHATCTTSYLYNSLPVRQTSWLLPV